MGTETMVGFGSKQAWLAVRDGDPAAVRTALRLRDLGPVSWRAGIDLAYLTDDRVAITPPLTGDDGRRWLLVAGRWLWRAAADFPVATLSAELGTEVQRYFSYRVAEQHEWERAAHGTLVRAFAYRGGSGELVRWIGDPDDAEAGLGLRGPDDEDILVGESDVMRLAGRWSVDPSALDGRTAPGPLHAAAPA